MDLSSGPIRRKLAALDISTAHDSLHREKPGGIIK